MSTTIKKREFKTKGNIRRRRDDDEEGGDGSDNEKADDIKRSALEQIREEQKMRKSQAGLAAVSTLEDVTSAAKAAPKKKTEGDEEEEEVQQKSISEMMDANFTGIHYRVQKNEVAHKQIMEQYIRERMGQGKKDNEEDEDKGGPLTKRDKLVKILEEIKVVPEADMSKGEGGVGEGAPIAWNTGLAEVALPIEYKLKNIEATEAARRQMESHHGGRRGERSDEVSGNLSTNFKKHQRDYAISMRERDRARGITGGYGGGRFAEGPSGRDAMSDDAVYERFKKRVRR